MMNANSLFPSQQPITPGLFNQQQSNPQQGMQQPQPQQAPGASQSQGPNMMQAIQQKFVEQQQAAAAALDQQKKQDADHLNLQSTAQSFLSTKEGQNMLINLVGHFPHLLPFISKQSNK